MTEQEFIRHWVGIPWLERGNSQQGIDCWALVVRYYKDVLSVNLEDDYGPDFLQGYLQEVQKWQLTTAKQGVAFMCYDKRTNEPCHVGVVVGNGQYIMHCKNTGPHGATRCDRLAAMLKLHPDMQFYEYIG